MTRSIRLLALTCFLSCSTEPGAEITEVGVDLPQSESFESFDLPMQDVPPRILRSGPGDSASRKPDCDHLTETPVPGVNCVDWGLPAWGPSMGGAARVIVLASVNSSVTAFYDQLGEVGSCTVFSGSEAITSEQGYVPLSFEALEWWKGTPNEVQNAAVIGDCLHGSLCTFCNPLGKWYVQPGLNLLLLNFNCCVDQYRKGYYALRAIYPVEGGALYDWDGTPIPLHDARSLFLKNLDEEPHDMLCYGPGDPPEVHDADAHVEQAEEF